MRTRSKNSLPLPVKRALIKLGQDLRDARLRRRLSTQIMVERAFISRMTLNKVEKGDPSVSMGIYATVIFVLGLTSQLALLIDSTHDVLGRALEDERLPKRIRSPNTKKVKHLRNPKISPKEKE